MLEKAMALQTLQPLRPLRPLRPMKPLLALLNLRTTWVLQTLLTLYGNNQLYRDFKKTR